MAKWFLVVTMILLTGTLSGCQKKAVQEEASVPVEEIDDANWMEGQEIAQSDEMGAVEDAGTQVAMNNVIETPTSVGQSIASVLPGPKEIQTALKNAGFYKGEIDGNIGPRTKQAIKDFQFKNKLSVDGKVGLKTWGILSSYLAQASTSVTETAQEITEIPAVQ